MAGDPPSGRPYITTLSFTSVLSCCSWQYADGSGSCNSTNTVDGIRESRKWHRQGQGRGQGQGAGSGLLGQGYFPSSTSMSTNTKSVSSTPSKFATTRGGLVERTRTKVSTPLHSPHTNIHTSSHTSTIILSSPRDDPLHDDHAITKRPFSLGEG